ncbi:MFS transporter [Lactobacillus amylovorus]|uniref:MFS transporter n=1 Tax=Lactobacillus amylovorus TaxID=1604 RepID=UPI00232CFE6C|nr:MFS transporter [Lactobacillus amylovorus]MDB6242502.1 MFS transporter [Lactobacillus amylovorus]MDB6244747.1 MFS transporter [Lactobacillus amylovorus]MDB6248497.1 MFS transporter [Lactobacillus amylovorus]MDB6253056.1 MFS transporter [Lactobacillus amylovorus]MDB6256655.1 MFS transporter [Lactobacillus amylovorus]
MFKSISRLLIGRIATNIADSLFYITILWYFKIIFHSPMILSLVFIADSTIDICAFIFGPLIDRVYIKNLLKYVTVGQIILSIVASILFHFKNWKTLTLVLLLLTYILSTIGSTLIYPAEEKILPSIVNKNKLTKVNSLFQVTYRILDLFLDALATVIVTYFSFNKAMAISAFVFTIALGFYAKLYLPRNLIVSEKDHDYFTGKYLQDLLKGWYVLKNEGRILLLIIPLAVTNLFYGIASVGMPYFSSQYLTKSAISYGGLELFSSIGGLLGSLIVSKIDTLKPNLEQLIVICLGLAGISVVLEALVANYIPWLILIFALSSAFWISIMNINFEVLIQESFSPRILGRIETINSSIINCMIPIGSFLGGLIIQHFGAGIAILLQGLAEVLTAIFYLIYLR